MGLISFKIGEISLIEDNERLPMLEVNDWIVINAITYKIHEIENIDEMRLNIMEQFHYLFDFDSASFYTVISKSKKDIGNPIGINYSISDMNNYLHIYKELDYSKGLMSTGKNITYRESDIMKDELRVQTQYYRDVYIPHNWHYSLHLNLSYNGIFLGVMSFFREKGKEDFEYTATFILDMIKDHLALRLIREFNQSEVKRMTLEECSVRYKLTSREQKILLLIIQGLTDQRICEQLFITGNTLKKHILNMYRKIGVSKRTQLFTLIQETIK